MTDFTLVSVGEKETLTIGITLGRLLTQPALIFLQGDLGAGKTVLARGIARGLGVPDEVPITSPTFTLMNHYSARLELYHFDLYRISDPDELLDIGFDDYVYGAGISLVEWPEKLESSMSDALWICLDRLDNHRRSLTFKIETEMYQPLLQIFRETLREREKAFDP